VWNDRLKPVLRTEQLGTAVLHRKQLGTAVLHRDGLARTSFSWVTLGANSAQWPVVGNGSSRRRMGRHSCRLDDEYGCWNQTAIRERAPGQRIEKERTVLAAGTLADCWLSSGIVIIATQNGMAKLTPKLNAGLTSFYLDPEINASKSNQSFTSRQL